MKKLMLFVGLLLSTAAVFAQQDSTQLSYPPHPSEVHLPPTLRHGANINPIYYFGHDFCSSFFEIKTIATYGDIGIGFTFANVPEVWGWYVSPVYSIASGWLTGGAVLRVAQPNSNTDFHLYAGTGLAYCDDHFHTLPTWEVGLRFAAPDGYRSGALSLMSGSIGLLSNFETTYVTLGLSLELSSVLAGLLLLY